MATVTFSDSKTIYVREPEQLGITDDIEVPFSSEFFQLIVGLLDLPEYKPVSIWDFEVPKICGVPDYQTLRFVEFAKVVEYFDCPKLANLMRAYYFAIARDMIFPGDSERERVDKTMKLFREWAKLNGLKPDEAEVETHLYAALFLVEHVDLCRDQPFYYWAIKKGFLHLAKQLVPRKIDPVDVRDLTLGLAVMDGNLELFKWMAGFVEHKDLKEYFIMAVKHGQRDICEYLAPTVSSGTVNLAIETVGEQGRKKLCRWLSGLSSTDPTVALKWALYFGDVEWSKAMIARGADLSRFDPLSKAVTSGKKEICEWVITLPGVRAGVQNAFIAAVILGHLELCKWLVDQGADPKNPKAFDIIRYDPFRQEMRDWLKSIA